MNINSSYYKRKKLKDKTFTKICFGKKQLINLLIVNNIDNIGLYIIDFVAKNHIAQLFTSSLLASL